MKSDIKVGDVFVDEYYPIELILNNKYLKVEIETTEYFPSTKQFAFKFGSQIECELDEPRKKAVNFALRCMDGVNLYDREYALLLSSIVKNYLKEIK